MKKLVSIIILVIFNKEVIPKIILFYYNIAIIIIS